MTSQGASHETLTSNATDVRWFEHCPNGWQSSRNQVDGDALTSPASHLDGEAKQQPVEHSNENWSSNRLTLGQALEQAAEHGVDLVCLNPYERAATTRPRSSAIGPLLVISSVSAMLAWIGWESGFWMPGVVAVIGLLAAGIVLWSVR